MNSLLSSLKDVCDRYPLQEKVLVVPGYAAGRELCEALARAGGGWVNLRPETTAGLAHRIAGEHLAGGKTSLLNGYLAATVVEEIFHTLEEIKALQYFRRKGNRRGLVKVIASSIFELRSFGVTSGDLAPESFTDTSKGRDMAALLKAYERYLEENNYIDKPGLLSLALKLLSFRRPLENKLTGGKQPNGFWQSINLTSNFSPLTSTIYLLPSFLRLNPLERRLVDNLAAGGLILLDPDPVYGVAPTGYRRSEPVKSSHIPPGPGENTVRPPDRDVERLPWLFEVDQAPPPVGDGSLDCFHSYGLLNEVREIFRRIQAQGVPLDTVTVACTNSEYIPAFYTLARRTGIGLTVAEGLPVFLTAPGRVLQTLVEWIKSDYAASVLIELFLGGDVRLQTGRADLSTVEAARLLRSAGIGWGRDRYTLLKVLADDLKKRAEIRTDEEPENGDERRGQLLRQSELAGELYTIISGMLSVLPTTDDAGEVGLRELAGGLAAILRQITLLKDEADAAALDGLTAALEEAGRLVSFGLETEEALERVEDILAGFRVGASGPKPGCLHLTGYRNLVWSARPNTFVAGMDANNFPGGTRQDPVLLDAERRAISPDLPLSTERPGENQYILGLALASRRGNVTLSFPSFNVVENREVFPSPVLLQVYRLLRGDASLDYTRLMNFLGKPAGYCAQGGMPALDETEWWIGRVLSKPGIRNGAAAVDACCRGIAWGRRALEARTRPALTEYDGLIGPSPHLDPRRNDELVMSCTKIEALAECPFAYFLRYVLNIQPPEDVACDPGRWLDPLARGELLHRLFYNFMRRVTADGERPGPAQHLSVMLEMAGDLIAEYRGRIPPPSEVVFDREVEDIRRCCEVFLTVEEMRGAGEPVLFEVPFGLGAEKVAAAGSGIAGPVAVELGEGDRFLLKGRIDRIDRAGEGVYHVWDYKTGGTYGFEEHRHFCGGRQVQHALYAVAAEHILREAFPGESPRAEISGYYFPTEKGEGLMIKRPQTDRGSLHRLLGCLFDLLAGGVFIAADKDDKCRFCDYTEVCGFPGAVARAKTLAAPGCDPRLDPWRRLKDFD